MKKTDIQFHRDSFLVPHPAVNVKLHGVLTEAHFVAFARDWAPDLGPIPDEFNLGWLRANVAESDQHLCWDFALESGWEDLQNDFDDVGLSARGGKLYSEGRSGGWAVAHNLPSVDSWDAITLSEWARFVQRAAEDVNAVWTRYLYEVYVRHFQPAYEAEQARRAFLEHYQGAIPAETVDWKGGK